MRPKAQVAVIRGVIILGFLGSAGVWVGLLSGGRGIPAYVPASVLVGSLIVAFILLLAAPVRCEAPGCHGRMKRNWINMPHGRSRLQYECRLCHHLVNTTVRFGGWDVP